MWPKNWEFALIHCGHGSKHQESKWGKQAGSIGSSNASGIPAQDRRRFEELFGCHSDYNADDITKITYGRNTIYEAPAAPVEEMGPVMQIGGM